MLTSIILLFLFFSKMATAVTPMLVSHAILPLFPLRSRIHFPFIPHSLGLDWSGDSPGPIVTRRGSDGMWCLGPTPEETSQLPSLPSWGCALRTPSREETQEDRFSSWSDPPDRGQTSGHHPSPMTEPRQDQQATFQAAHRRVRSNGSRVVVNQYLVG